MGYVLSRQQCCFAVACGSLSIACSEAVEVDVQPHSISDTLTATREIESHQNAKYFYRAGQRIVAHPVWDGFTFNAKSPTGETAQRPAHRLVGRHGHTYLYATDARPGPLGGSQDGWITPKYRMQGARGPAYLAPHLYVKLSKVLGAPAHEQWAARNGLAIAAHLSLKDWVYVRVTTDPIDEARRLVESGQALEAHPSVFVSTELYGIEPLAPNDTYYGEQWNLHNRGGFTNADGRGTVKGSDHPYVAEAWQLLKILGLGATHESFGASVRLAIIDDGFDIQHEDLAGKFISTRNFGTDDIVPGNMFSNNSTTKNFHGTMVTGIAAATTHNEKGIAGACPGCQLIGARMSASSASSGLASDLYYDQIFKHVLDRDAHIINCSWGPDNSLATTYYSELMDRITTQGRGGKGTVVVLASGNAGEDFSWNGLATHPRAIAVGASDSTGHRHGFSNYGSNLSLLAPTSGGVKQSSFGSSKYLDRIWTTDNFLSPACLKPGNQPRSGCSDNAGWTPNHPMAGGDGWWGKYSFRFSHTSAAAPLVSGIVGLMLHANPDLTVDQVLAILTLSADKVAPSEANYDTSGHSIAYGYGRVNALRAVAMAFIAAGGSLHESVRRAIDETSPCTRTNCWNPI